jgi:hypothetical protein
MKNKPYPALLGGSYLFNEIKKRTPKSRETIPLSKKGPQSKGRTLLLGKKPKKKIHHNCINDEMYSMYYPDKLRVFL